MDKTNEIFNIWNSKKIIIHNDDKKKFIGVREIWYVSLGSNIGYEEDGKGEEFLRPVLVVSKIGNMFYVIPMTTKGKKSNKYYHRILSIDFGKPSHIILSQGRVVDRKRFVRFIQKGQKISVEEYKEIQKKLKDLYLPTL